MVIRTTGAAARMAGLVARHYLKKPDQEELLRIKFPDAPSLGWAAANEAAYRLRAARSVRLTTLNVEITNRCNLRCGYCPVNRSMARPKSDLPLEAFEDLLARAPTVTTLLPFQWGEPLLHPDLFEMVRLARVRGIRTYVTTNGTLLDPPRRRAILDSGITRLTISVDGDDATHAATRGVELAPIRENVLALRRERDLAGAAMRIDVSMVIDQQTESSLADYRRAWSPLVDRVQAIPRLVREPRTTVCREPWRGLLVVLADGRVTTCCGDTEGELLLGSIHDSDPAEIFNGEPMRQLREAHACGRFPRVCADCSEYRHAEVNPRFS